MKFGEIINKDQKVLIVFGHWEHIHSFACDIAQSLSQKITVNTVAIERNEELCNALRIHNPTVLLYEKGMQVLRIKSHDPLEISNKINQQIGCP